MLVGHIFEEKVSQSHTMSLIGGPFNFQSEMARLLNSNRFIWRVQYEKKRAKIPSVRSSASIEGDCSRDFRQLVRRAHPLTGETLIAVIMIRSLPDDAPPPLHRPTTRNNEFQFVHTISDFHKFPYP